MLEEYYVNVNVHTFEISYRLATWLLSNIKVVDSKYFV